MSKIILILISTLFISVVWFSSCERFNPLDQKYSCESNNDCSKGYECDPVAKICVPIESAGKEEETEVVDAQVESIDTAQEMEIILPDISPDIELFDPGEAVDAIEKDEQVSDLNDIPEISDIAEIEAETDCCALKDCAKEMGNPGECMEAFCDPELCSCVLKILKGKSCTDDNLPCTDDSCSEEGNCEHSVKNGFCVIKIENKDSCVAENTVKDGDQCLLLTTADV
jgi:hypothetical protein